MKMNKVLWLSIAAAALIITGNAFAANTTTPPAAASAGSTVAETAKHHGQRHQRGMRHAGAKAKDAVDSTVKKVA